MTSLDRLVDGLHVEIERLPSRLVAGASRAVIQLAGGAALHFSRHRLVVVPPPRPWAAAPGDSRTARRWTAAACARSIRGGAGLFDLLREPLMETVADGDPLQRAVDDLLDEVAVQRPGARAMAEALLRRCLILLLRRCFERERCRGSWLSVVEDARLGPAVSAMQERPEHPFTLCELAGLAAMSRSVFAARFFEAAGQSPLEFLKRLRLHRAADFLVHSDLPVKSISARVGYASRSAFTRAFVAHHGVGPAAFRTAAHEPGPRRATSTRMPAETVRVSRLPACRRDRRGGRRDHRQEP